MGKVLVSFWLILSFFLSYRPLTFVRLGEHDLSTDTETRHLDVPVAKVDIVTVLYLIESTTFFYSSPFRVCHILIIIIALVAVTLLWST